MVGGAQHTLGKGHGAWICINIRAETYPNQYVFEEDTPLPLDPVLQGVHISKLTVRQRTQEMLSPSASFFHKEWECSASPRIQFMSADNAQPAKVRFYSGEI